MAYRRSLEGILQRVDNAGFSYAGLAGQQDDLAFALQGKAPTPRQHSEFLVPTHDRGQPPFAGGDEAADTAHRQSAIGLHGSGDPLECLRPQIVEVETTGDQVPGGSR